MTRRGLTAGALAELLDEIGVPVESCRITRSPFCPPGDRDYVVAPSLGRPQVIAPIGAAGGTMIGERRSSGTLARLGRRGYAWAVRTSLLARLPVARLRIEDAALQGLLAQVGGREGLVCGIMVGPKRANRKPVLRVFDDQARTWGFVKMGVNDLTNALVRREAAAIDEVAALSMTAVRVPRVLGLDEWRGRTILALEALASGADQRQPKELPVGPTRELQGRAAAHGVRLADAPGLRVAAPGPTTSRGSRVEFLAGRLLALAGDERVSLGAAHGDWTPWNMAWTGSRLDVWDWERFGTGVPHGMDAIHFEAHRVQSDDPAQGEGRFLMSLPGVLQEVGVDAALTDTLLATYLVLIGRRYAADLALEEAPRLGRRLDWVVGLLESRVARLESAVPS